MKEIILKLAVENPYGFTFNIRTKKMVKYGIAVAYSDTQNCFGIKGLEKVIDHAQSHNGIVGGWLNTENLNYYFDSIKVFKDKNEAISFGRENKQIAIFDITNLEEIVL